MSGRRHRDLCVFRGDGEFLGDGLRQMIEFSQQVFDRAGVVLASQPFQSSGGDRQLFVHGSANRQPTGVVDE